MAKSKIYTRTGDEGYTSLAGGKRVPKNNPRIEAYGTVDELNSFIALLREESGSEEDREFLRHIQSNLFAVGGDLASEKESAKCIISEGEIRRIEEEIDLIDSSLPPLKYFILPGGCRANALAHICRTVCRRAERCAYELRETEEVNSNTLKYLNRLSDYFFLLARKENFIHNIDENSWENSCT